jgi:hypothetical protein
MSSPARPKPWAALALAEESPRLEIDLSDLSDAAHDIYVSISFFRRCFFVFLAQPHAKQAYETLFLPLIVSELGTFVDDTPPSPLSQLLGSLFVSVGPMPDFPSPLAGFLLSGYPKDLSAFPQITDEEILRIFVDRFARLAFYCIRHSCTTFEEAQHAIEQDFAPAGEDTEDHRDAHVIISNNSGRPFSSALNTFNIPESREKIAVFLQACVLWCITPDQAIVNNEALLSGGASELLFYRGRGPFEETLRQANHICYICRPIPR